MLYQRVTRIWSFNYCHYVIVESWCKSQGKRRIGVPTYEGSGSHVYRGQRYRFLVIPRYGIDIGKLFLSYRRKLPTKLVNTLAVQMVCKSHTKIELYI